MGGAAIMANVILGEELGLYRAMADGNPVTPEQLAERTNCNARLVREWLSGQAASGYVEHDHGRFRLPEEQAMALAQEDSPVYVAGGAVVLASMYFDKDKVVTAMRGDGALSWADHHPCLFSRHRALLPARLSRPPGQRMAAGARRRGAAARSRAPRSPTSAAVTAPRRSSWRRRIRSRRSIGFDYHDARSSRRASAAAEAGSATASASRSPAAEEFPGHRLRPRLLLRLPARHGRPGRRAARTSARR